MSAATGPSPSATAPATASDARVAFVLRLGRALHRYGTPSHRLEETLDQVSRHLGLDGQFFSQPTSIFAAFGPQDEQHTFLLRFEPGDIHLERLARVDAVVHEVLAGTITPDVATARLAAIDVSLPPYPAVLTLIASGVSSAAACRFLGGGARDIAAAAVVGAAIGGFAVLAALWPGMRRVFEPVAACLAAVIAGALGHAWAPVSVYTATLAGLIVLLPGLSLATAMTEISNRHLAAGTARLSGAIMVFLAIGFGVALGGALVDRALGTPPEVLSVPMAAWTEGLALLVAPLSLMVLLRAPSGDAPWVLLVGILTFWGGRAGATALGPELGIFVGSLTAGVASNLYGRLLRRPPTIPLVPALLLLVPGSVGFRSLVLMMRSDVIVGVEAAFRMVIMLSALVAGLLISNVVMPEGRRRS
jgi:uncharacterized membrane protein YjjP (DUF1212 family)